MTTSILDAFIKQTYGSAEKAIEADKLADHKEAIEKEAEKQRHQDAIAIMSRPQTISNYMSIPTKLNPDELNDTTKPHPQMAKYDHSLEVDRVPIVRQKVLDEKYKDNPEEKPCVDIDFKHLDTGSVEDMFADILPMF